VPECELCSLQSYNIRNLQRSKKKLLILVFAPLAFLFPRKLISPYKSNRSMHRIRVEYAHLLLANGIWTVNHIPPSEIPFQLT
jgi:tRNA/tmRNA/rRNA uracil-C5-methylase (TrmA/RlmC/RlmD family)